MDDYKSCCNKCIFCFIDQMPKGMRDTLYFKDDDSRLSFLSGNYVTLTNMKEKDIERIIRYNLFPINISFHTTNPDLRCKMLNNKRAGEALAIVDRFYDAEIEMNGQIVLCKGVNDGEELERTIRDLSRYLPFLKSVSIVPVGITRFRDDLPKLTPFTKEDAIRLIDMVERYQNELFDKWGLHFIHASDEWYILAGREMPSAKTYDGYLQLENGVGMMRLLHNEFNSALKNARGDERTGNIHIATGLLAGEFIKSLVKSFNKKYPNVKVEVHCIKNNFFGERITVAGLVTGKDIIEQLSGVLPGEDGVLLIPDNMLKRDEDIFLDDTTLKDLEKALHSRVFTVKSSGQDLLDALLVNTL